MNIESSLNIVDIRLGHIRPQTSLKNLLWPRQRLWVSNHLLCVHSICFVVYFISSGSLRTRLVMCTSEKQRVATHVGTQHVLFWIWLLFGSDVLSGCVGVLCLCSTPASNERNSLGK